MIIFFNQLVVSVTKPGSFQYFLTSNTSEQVAVSLCNGRPLTETIRTFFSHSFAMFDNVKDKTLSLDLPLFENCCLVICPGFADGYSLELTEKLFNYKRLITILVGFFLLAALPPLFNKSWVCYVTFGAVTGLVTWLSGILLIITKFKRELTSTKERKSLAVTSVVAFILALFELYRKMNNDLFITLSVIFVLCLIGNISFWYWYGPVSYKVLNIIKFYSRSFGLCLIYYETSDFPEITVMALLISIVLLLPISSYADLLRTKLCLLFSVPMPLFFSIFKPQLNSSNSEKFTSLISSEEFHNQNVTRAHLIQLASDCRNNPQLTKSLIKNDRLDSLICFSFFCMHPEEYLDIQFNCISDQELINDDENFIELD